MNPVRTCLGCRQRTDRSSLSRIVALDGAAVVDHTATLPGRGAWVHPTLDCVDTSIKRKAFGRALRVDGALDVGGIRQALIQMQSMTTDPHPSATDNRLNGEVTN